VLALFVLAPWAAECSWGGFALGAYPFVVLFLAPLYGGAALLIRETVRRTGGGWPAIILLAAAFGVFQAGLVDQSLFNPHYLDDTQFAPDTEIGKQLAADATWVPFVGFSAQQAISFIGNHIALSMCAPIAIVETFVGPERRYRPWLRRPGVVVVAVVYVLGSLLVFSDSGGRKGFLLGVPQLVVAVLAVALLIGAALRRGPKPSTADLAANPTSERRAPQWMWVIVVTAGASASANLTTGWPGVAFQLTAAATAAVLIVRCSRRAGWDQRHVLAAWAGGLLVAAGFAYVVPNYDPASTVSSVVGDVAISVITLALLGGAGWRLHRTGSPAVVDVRADEPVVDLLDSEVGLGRERLQRPDGGVGGGLRP
jgi:hypothetical protein